MKYTYSAYAGKENYASTFTTPILGCSSGQLQDSVMPELKTKQFEFILFS